MSFPRATLTGFSAILMWSLLAVLTVASGRVPPFQLAALTFAIGGAIGAAWVAHAGAWAALRQEPVVWALGVGGLVFRVLQLAVIRDLRTGLAWATKIITDPFHDIQLYHRAPLQLLRGERLDPALWPRADGHNAGNGEQTA